jgi:hypothetical protein
MWLPNGETGQADARSSESGDGRKEEREEQAPGLMEKIVRDENAALALTAVEKNGGSAGIDGMETEQLRPHLEKHRLTMRKPVLRRPELLKQQRDSTAGCEKTACPVVWEGWRVIPAIPTRSDRLEQQFIAL